MAKNTRSPKGKAATSKPDSLPATQTPEQAPVLQLAPVTSEPVVIATYQDVEGMLTEVYDNEKYAEIQPTLAAKENAPLLKDVASVFVDFKHLHDGNYLKSESSRTGKVVFDVNITKFPDGALQADAIHVQDMIKTLMDANYADVSSAVGMRRPKTNRTAPNGNQPDVAPNIPVKAVRVDTTQSSANNQPVPQSTPQAAPAAELPANPQPRATAVMPAQKRYSGVVDRIIERSPTNIFAFITSPAFRENVFAPPASFQKISAQVKEGDWISFTADASRTKPGQFVANNLKKEDGPTPSQPGSNISRSGPQRGPGGSGE